MLKILLDPTNLNPEIKESVIMVQGNALEVVSEIGYVIADIYNGMKRYDPEMAKAFQHLVGVAYLPESPVWRTNTTVPGGESVFIPDFRQK